MGKGHEGEVRGRSRGREGGRDRRVPSKDVAKGMGKGHDRQLSADSSQQRRATTLLHLCSPWSRRGPSPWPLSQCTLASLSLPPPLTLASLSLPPPLTLASLPLPPPLTLASPSLPPPLTLASLSLSPPLTPPFRPGPRGCPGLPAGALCIR